MKKSYTDERILFIGPGYTNDEIDEMFTGLYECLLQYTKSIFDLVALDMIMPEMSGKETYERLKEIDPDVKVLLVSGYSLNKQVEELMDLGCNGFIQKPFDILQLSQKIREVLMSGRRKVKSNQAPKFE